MKISIQLIENQWDKWINNYFLISILFSAVEIMMIKKSVETFHESGKKSLHFPENKLNWDYKDNNEKRKTKITKAF